VTRVRGLIARSTDPTLSAWQTHPWEIGFALLFVLTGISLFLGGSAVDLGGQPMPLYLVVAWEVGCLLGGAAMALGCFWNGLGTWGRAIERAGLYTIAATWSTFTAAVIAFAGVHDPVSLGQGLVVISACLGRSSALRKVDRVVQKAVEIEQAEEVDP
jgi:hypothetical protein